MVKPRVLSVVPAAPTRADRRVDTDRFEDWRLGVRCTVLSQVREFVGGRRALQLDQAGLDGVGNVLMEFVSGGKCLRSTFMYLGWLCGAEPSDTALRAAANLELLHAFALLQDDVMDDSDSRRGRPAVHNQLARLHREHGLSGSSRRFGDSAAVLIGDLCLIWAEQMLRESGVEGRRLQQAWPRYDAMRIELALGQFADLAANIRDLPPLEAVLEVARRKSGNYTVRRPLEIGAAMAGCGDRTLTQLGRYGAAIGEAFQLRDDVLGVFGSPSITGKPSGGDLLERKATSVIVSAYQMADAPTRRELSDLMNGDDFDDATLYRCRRLIVSTGAVQWIEDMIRDRVAFARKALNDAAVDESVRTALAKMAAICTERAQ